MTQAQANTMIKELQQIRAYLSSRNSDWTDTKGLLLILRRKNHRIAKYVREHFMKASEYRVEGRNFEYSVFAAHAIRSRADKGEITIPK